MTSTIKSPRSATLNMEGIDVPLLKKFLGQLPVEAQKNGKISIQHSPYINQFDRGSTSLRVSWSEDLGPAPAA